jgi:hypothetical protein
MSTMTDVRLTRPRWRAASPGRAHRVRVRLAIAIAVPLAVFYLAWLLRPERVGDPVLYAVLVAAELFNLTQALGFWWTCARERSRRPLAPHGALGIPEVDVFIPVYGEDVQTIRTTAVAALALGDGTGQAWLTSHQVFDGRFSTVPGKVEPDAATPLGALALSDTDARRRALDALDATRARSTPSEPLSPHDPAARGWGWTPRTFGWVEPTAWAVLALKRLRPDARDLIEDGERVLADRECTGGGWNYGNRTVYGQDLAPYAQTTAVAMLALQRSSRTDLADRGLHLLSSRWGEERGGLSLGLTAAALRIWGDAAGAPAGGEVADQVEAALGELFERSGFLDDVLALGWAVVATGPGLESLRVGPP